MELAFLLVLFIWVFHFKSSENVIPKYGLSCTCLTAKTQSDRDIQRGICYGLITSSLLPKIV